MPKLPLPPFFLKNVTFFRKSFLPPFSESCASRFLFFVRHCLWFVWVAALSATAKVKVPASSFAVVGGDKRGTHMVVCGSRTYEWVLDQLDPEGCYRSTYGSSWSVASFRIKLIRKCIIFCICCFCIYFPFFF